MPFIQQDQPIQTLTTHAADHPLAKCIRLWCPHGRLENGQTHGRHGGIDALGIDAVAVVNEPSMGLVACNHHPELLRRPSRRRMVGHIPVQDPARADVQHHEDVEHAERGRDRDEEIARQHGAGMIAPCLFRDQRGYRSRPPQ